MYKTPSYANVVLFKKAGGKKNLYVIDFNYDEGAIWSVFISVNKPGFWVGNSMCLN